MSNKLTPWLMEAGGSMPHSQRNNNNKNNNNNNNNNKIKSVAYSSQGKNTGQLNFCN